MPVLRMGLILVLLQSLLGLGCSDTPSLATQFTFEATRKPLFAFDARGGDFCNDSNLCVRIPEQTVSGLTQVFGYIKPAPNGAVGFSYVLEVEDTRLLKPIKLELPVPTEHRQRGLMVVFRDGQAWKSVPTVAGSQNATRIGTTDHLSEWTLAPQSTCQGNQCLTSGPTCASGQTLCGSQCVNLQADNNHCGSCQNACPSGQTCQKGACQSQPPTCTGGKTLCNGSCVDLQSDNAHCGACGTTCQANETCQQGQCSSNPPTCTGGKTLCNSSCVDLQSDTANCGSCGTACASGETCQNGACQKPSTPKKACYTMLCNGTCVDHEYDENNCGGCGVKCSSSEVCCGGKCIAHDDNNCGGCGLKCLPFDSCQNGTCKRRPDLCPTGLTYCKGRCVDLKTNHANCGACGKVCPTTVACTNGVCTGARFNSCQPGQSACVGVCKYVGGTTLQCSSCVTAIPCKGNVCTDPYDVKSCGGCGLQCPPNFSCSSFVPGECVYGDYPVPAKCGDLYVTLDLTQQHHCGACYSLCPPRIKCPPGAVFVCSCGSDLLCDGRCWARGGNQNYPINPNHCGACNNICPQGTQCGSRYKCVQGSPNQGWTWCGARWAQLTSDAIHCGKCNNTCPHGHFCSGGQCRKCSPGQTVCANNTVRTCKTDGSGWTDQACSSQTVCVNGSCVATTCTPNQSTCLDSKTVGTCDSRGISISKKQTCASGEFCTNGSCQKLTCAPGSKRCASNTALEACKSDGSGWTTTNCSAGQTCSLGVCQAQCPITKFQLYATLSAHTDRVRGVALSPDQKLIASTSSDRTTRIWDLTTKKLLQTLKQGNSYTTGVHFSPDGKLLAVGSFDNTIHVWDTSTWQIKAVLRGHSKGVRNIDFNSSGSLLLSSSDDRTARLWDMKTYQMLHILSGHTYYVKDVNITADGKRAVTSASDRTVRLWDLTTKQTTKILTNHTYYVDAVALSPNEKYLATGSKELLLWSFPSGTLLRTLEPTTAGNYTGSLIFTPDNKYVVSASSNVRFWDVATGKLVHTIPNATPPLDIDKQGRWLLSSIGNDVQIWYCQP